MALCRGSPVTMASSASAKKSTLTSAPMKGKPPRRGKVPCGVCQGSIMDGKDEALLCEGKCGLWFHRGCASVPPCLYKELSNSEEPFVCLSCTNIQLKNDVLLLKSELKEMAVLRDTCTTLAAEVSSLREALDSMKRAKPASPQPQTSEHLKRTYARVARTRQVPRSSAADNRETKRTEKSQLPPKNVSENPSANSRPKVKVDGARRIWNTLQTCSANAVASTISKLIPTKLNLRVKRKTKSTANNKAVWWFVVHGSESDLVILERDWDKVHQQTLWSLQSCYMSPDSLNANPESASATNSLSPTPSSNHEPHSSETGSQPSNAGHSADHLAVPESGLQSPLVSVNTSSFLEVPPPPSPLQQSTQLGTHPPTTQ